MAEKNSPRRQAGGQTGAGNVSPGTTVPRRQPRCPWLAGAARTGDLAVVLTVIRMHPPGRCPAMRGRAA
jgi:hypothetical protein